MPPVDLTGATGLRFSCGWSNPRPVEVGWGIGDQEMCVMLGLVEGAALFDALVGSGDTEVGTDPEGRNMREGPCTVTMLPKNANQGMPTQEEIDAPLYVPTTAQGPDDVTVVPECEDTDGDQPPPRGSARELDHEKDRERAHDQVQASRVPRTSHELLVFQRKISADDHGETGQKPPDRFPDRLGFRRLGLGVRCPYRPLHADPQDKQFPGYPLESIAAWHERLGLEC